MRNVLFQIKANILPFDRDKGPLQRNLLLLFSSSNSIERIIKNCIFIIIYFTYLLLFLLNMKLECYTKWCSIRMVPFIQVFITLQHKLKD